ncbi:MAG: folate-binding protein [Gammaproteobacteria bacterium]|nr:folate-binding protein [Gammaproteobacteria bacterium]
MNKQWSEFLQSRPDAISDPQAACALNDLSHLGLIQVDGEDALEFLQGQMTNDMREVNEQHSNLSGWCTAKGRMLANFRVFRMAGAYYLQTPLANIDSVMKRLGMFVLMAKVTLTDASDQLARFGLTGDCAESLLDSRFPKIPACQNGAIEHNDVLLIRMPGPNLRYELVGPASELIRLWEDFESKAIRLDRNYWALQEIRAGIPTVFPETTETFIPQMVNMQLTDGVSFTKGCYTGQEIVARMQYLGKLKRRMYLTHVKAETAPRPGDELFAEDSSSGQGTGKVVDAQAAVDGYDMLAVIEIESAENKTVHLGENGPVVEISELPYEFASESG